MIIRIKFGEEEQKAKSIVASFGLHLFSNEIKKRYPANKPLQLSLLGNKGTGKTTFARSVFSSLTSKRTQQNHPKTTKSPRQEISGNTLYTHYDFYGGDYKSSLNFGILYEGSGQPNWDFAAPPPHKLDNPQDFFGLTIWEHTAAFVLGQTHLLVLFCDQRDASFSYLQSKGERHGELAQTATQNLLDKRWKSAIDEITLKEGMKPRLQKSCSHIADFVEKASKGRNERTVGLYPLTDEPTLLKALNRFKNDLQLKNLS